MRKKTMAIIGAATIGILAVTGVAYASIPGPDGVIHACRKNTDGTLRAIDSAATCPSGWTALNWNQTGPQGPAGVSGHEVVTVAVNVPAHENGQASAFCPAGKVVTGGGYHLSSPPAGLNTKVWVSWPFANGTTWEWDVVVTNDNDFTDGVTAYAICVTAN